MSHEHEHEYEALYSAIIPSVVSVYRSADSRGGAGSGFVYDDRHVVTNAHVVGDVDRVDVRFSDGDWRVGTVAGTDAYTDLAVLRVDDLPATAEGLSVAENGPEPGTPVAALGNPMGLDGSITTGVVSGRNRSMATAEGFTIPDVVQTDAAVNPGSSGGPLVTLDGTVVGVNRARGGDNIGFAVSAPVIRRVVPALIADGRYRHAYLRVRTLDVSPTVAEANGLEEARGVLVVDVDLGPASGALVGCRRRARDREVPVGGDVLISVDDRPIDSHEALTRYLLLETAPGDEIELELLRDGRQLTERVTLAERPRVGSGDAPARRGRGRRRDRGRGDDRTPPAR